MIAPRDRETQEAHLKRESADRDREIASNHE
jgi:hypothetical protein